NIGPDGNAKMGKIIHGVFQISLWAIWKWRNRIVNASANSSPKIKKEDIFPVIQTSKAVSDVDRCPPCV
ncbi:hypothetical protein Tco_1341036, partial [Tanacetum coccineum]